MNLIHCRVKINDYHTGLVENVTPAEVIVLRHLHDASAGGNCIVEARKAGKALMHVPGQDGARPQIRERTTEEEYARLRGKYKGLGASGKNGTTFLDDLFPGVSLGTQQLPASFEALPAARGLAVAILEAKPPFVRTIEQTGPEPVNEAEAAKIMAEADKAEVPITLAADGEDLDDKDGADLSGPVRGGKGKAKARELATA